MAVDEALLEAAAFEGQCSLRFYRWAEPTLSLGYFQTYADRWRHEASRQAAVVRRHTGGGAILHDIELTYSIAVPDRHPLAADRLGFYRSVHASLIAVLASWQVEARMVTEADSAAEPESRQQRFLCFQRRAPGDVLVGGAKIAGSAQRRCRGAVLQHGSVLLACSPVAPELAGLKELTGKVIAADQLVDAWIRRLACTWSIPSTVGSLSLPQYRRATALVGEKYATPRWTEFRGRD